ncbi:snRNA-activating protein complex subunit 2-like isoform X2 [Corticium candelabrum]|uniref:snRNA-activating protein complex subunit 2-like isoform X2 n=1 Tax=Corticium candelabrum TaxID=121492 RepID=UPI002E25DA12|nr:snRNA-activating protein complex subunit 2-like isoform X2 [Corticium candelabrum]
MLNCDTEINLHHGHMMCNKDNGKYDWEALASHVQTKSTDQVRTYVRRIRARAKQGASSRSEDKPPIDEWIALSEKLSKDSTAVKSCLSQIMRLAAVEPLPTMECPTPNYSLIYKYLACLVSGEMVPDLPPTESIVVLDLVRDLMEHLSSCDITPQSAHMRKMYPRLVKKTASSAAHTAMEDDASSSSTQEPIPAEDSDTPRLQPSLSAVLQSFNPFDIPVQLLSPSLKRDDE